MRKAIAVAILAYSSAAAGLTIDLGQFTLSNLHTAHINVVNPGPGWIQVRLVFSDGSGNTLVEHNETLQDGHSTTLSLAGKGTAGDPVRAKVLALKAAPGSTCRPDATLQLTPKNPLSISSISRGTVRRTALNANEDAATHALRTFAQAQGLYYDGKRARGEPPAYASSVEELEQAGILPKGYLRDLEAKTGYSFKFASALLTHSVLAINRTGDRAFYVDETGVIRPNPIDHDPCGDPPAALEN